MLIVSKVTSPPTKKSRRTFASPASVMDDFKSQDEVDSSDDYGDAGTICDKRKRDDVNEDEKREERRAANRRSALESRQRRKVLIEDLQKQVASLNKETTELRAINETLRVQLESSLSENQQLRLMISQQLGGASAGLQGAMASGPSVALFGGGIPRGGTLGGGFPGYLGASQGMFGCLGGPSTSLLGHGSFGGFGGTDLSGGQAGKRMSFGTQSHGQMGDVARQLNIGHNGGFSDVNGNDDIEALAKRARILNEFSKKYPPG